MIRLLSTLIFLTINLTLIAQVDAPVMEKVRKSSPELDQKSLLWEVTGKDLEQPSYIYGTIHMIPKEDFFLTDATKAAFDKSSAVTFEINMEEMNSITALFSILGSVMMDNGTTLKDLLSEEEYALVSDHFQKVGLPLFMLERVKPFFLSTFADTDMMGGGGMGDGSIVSYEMEFMKMAQEKELVMDGLETIEFQMGIFDSIPYPDQAQMLVESIKASSEETEGDDQFDEMVKLYKDQNIQGMQNMFDEEGGIGDYEDVLLVKRNENWIPIMEVMMGKNSTFFAVGAGHLGGSKGVLQLLMDRGYTLTAQP